MCFTSPLTNSIKEDPFQFLRKDLTCSCSTEGLFLDWLCLKWAYCLEILLQLMNPSYFLFIFSVRWFIETFADDLKLEAFAFNAMQAMVRSLHEKTACTRYSFSLSSRNVRRICQNISFPFLEPALPFCPVSCSLNIIFLLLYSQVTQTKVWPCKCYVQYQGLDIVHYTQIDLLNFFLQVQTKFEDFSEIIVELYRIFTRNLYSVSPECVEMKRQTK